MALASPGPQDGKNSCNTAGDCDQVFSYPMFRDLEKSQAVFSRLAAHRSFGANLAYKGQTLSGSGMMVSGSYFPMLGVQLAVIEPGGYFGEMSLLTGEPRTATVVARGEAVVLELDAPLFRRLGEESPQTLEQVGLAAMTRREQLERARTVARDAGLGDAPATFLARMKRFLRLK